jgi:hypothetical protein
MPRSKQITLAGKEYSIEQLPMRANKEWRDSLGKPVLSLIQLIQDFGSLEFKPSDIGRIITVVKDLLLSSMDTLLDALFAYSPALAADRERIENEAYDDEAIAALGACVALAYPLDQALTGLKLGGLPVTSTSTNSPSRNGGNGTKLPTTGPRRTTTKT